MSEEVQTPSTASVNAVGLSRKDYMGAKSTLCTGCGHDSITNNIISAFYQSDIHPFKVAKLSGIGCSSKTPAYFLSMSHGFNSIHGRLAPVATGSKIANPTLSTIGVSGDGDTASIGLGGFSHLIRRNLPMVYIIENNGVYGLTKGQFSATAEKDMTKKGGEANPFTSIDLCSLAIELGCGFVARSFSGDSKQLVPLIDAALRHNGTAVIDVISPCVTFANHDGSTKSYNYVKEHKVSLQELGFIQPKQEIKVDYPAGSFTSVEMPDGSHLILKKLSETEHDIRDANAALNVVRSYRQKGQIVTGLFHLNSEKPSLIQTLNLTDKELAMLDEKDTRPSQQALHEMMFEFR